MIINTNMASLNTVRQLGINEKATQSSLAKLSSGLRINTAADDAAGLAISEKMRGQISGLNKATSNAQDGISLVGTAEGSLNETTSILQRMRELAVQSSNDTATTSDRTAMQTETDQLASEITRISNTTQFNTKNLLDGGVQAGNVGQLTFQIGANAGQNMSISINAMDAFSLGVAGSTATGAVTSTGNLMASASITRTVGSGITNGATVGVSAANVVAAAGTTAALTAGSDSGAIETTTNSTELNGYSIKFTDTGTGAANTLNTAVDTVNKQITVSANFSAGGGGAAPADMTAVFSNINTTLGSNGFTAQLQQHTGGSLAVADLGTGGTASFSAIGGGSDGSLTAITLGGSQIINVKDTDTSFTVNSGTYQGLTVNLTQGKQASNLVGAGGTQQVVITATGSSAATFSNGVVQNAANASAGIDISTQTSANNAITTIDNAIQTVSAERSKLGAVQNRLEHTINNLGTSSQNITTAEANIRDVDMAKEMTNFQKNNILQQAAQAMLAQANQQGQGVLQLLR